MGIQVPIILSLKIFSPAICMVNITFIMRTIFPIETGAHNFVRISLRTNLIFKVYLYQAAIILYIPRLAKYSFTSNFGFGKQKDLQYKKCQTYSYSLLWHNYVKQSQETWNNGVKSGENIVQTSDFSCKAVTKDTIPPTKACDIYSVISRKLSSSPGFYRSWLCRHSYHLVNQRAGGTLTYYLVCISRPIVPHTNRVTHTHTHTHVF